MNILSNLAGKFSPAAGEFFGFNDTEQRLEIKDHAEALQQPGKTQLYREDRSAEYSVLCTQHV